MIVDDDRAFLTILEALLESIGIKSIVKATSGREAYQHLRASKKVFDCILCDYAMGPGTGLQLLHAIRTGKTPVRPDMCIILVTASSDVSTVGVAAQLDVSGYLVKPVTAAKLRSAITAGRSRFFRIDIARYNQVFLSDTDRTLQTPAPSQ